MLDDKLHDSIHIEISARAASPSLTNDARRPTTLFSSGKAISSLTSKRSGLPAEGQPPTSGRKWKPWFPRLAAERIN